MMDSKLLAWAYIGCFWVLPLVALLVYKKEFRYMLAIISGVLLFSFVNALAIRVLIK
jgi:hypothetical protein